MCEKSTRDSVDSCTKCIDITFQIPSGDSTQYLFISCVSRSFCAAHIYLCKLIQIDLFGCFSSWKFKLQNVLGNEILLPEFTFAACLVCADVFFFFFSYFQETYLLFL